MDWEIGEFSVRSKTLYISYVSCLDIISYSFVLWPVTRSLSLVSHYDRKMTFCFQISSSFFAAKDSFHVQSLKRVQYFQWIVFFLSFIPWLRTSVELFISCYPIVLHTVMQEPEGRWQRKPIRGACQWWINF